MHLQQAIQSLAASLSQAQWTYFDTKLILQQRLPPRLQHLAPSLARRLVSALPQPYAPSARTIAQTLASFPETGQIARYAEPRKLVAPFPIAPQKFAPIDIFQSLNLPDLSSCDELAEWLAIPPIQLVRFADLNGLSNRTKNAFAPHYRFHIIPKSDGTSRLIEEPKPVLKRLQRRVLRSMLNQVPASPHAFGFVQKRTCIQAAARHCGEPVVVSFDLKNYFTSITYPRIFGVFRCLGYPADVARHLTGLVTLVTPAHVRAQLGRIGHHDLRRRHLPQGAPTSPALANLCSFNLDRRLAGLAQSLDATYTRYADDLTFSGETHIARTLCRAVPDIIRDERFTTNPDKTRVMPSHRSQVVTGIVVNHHVKITRKDFDRLKARIHRLKSQGKDQPETLQHLDGQIAWVEQVNPHKGAKLRQRFEHALSLT
ncbi:reverse transcriptase family protein [Ruegeria sp. HKCCD7255]|uniref:reverse transcriptase family protein n=1 Tax=Ruegeria sp. HKCCD7255 TaxID=2683004 RepID=UPI0014887772|nr:reverse transcriptase family protein [Ruegeria sp. HKCCD7255]